MRVGHYRRQTIKYIKLARRFKAEYIKAKLDGKSTRYAEYHAMNNIMEALELVRLNRNANGHIYVYLLNEWVKLRNMQL